MRLHPAFGAPAGELQIAVSTGGRSPALAREIRRRLERLFSPDYAEVIARVGEARRRARAVAPTAVTRLCDLRMDYTAVGQTTHLAARIRDRQECRSGHGRGRPS